MSEDRNNSDQIAEQFQDLVAPDGLIGQVVNDKYKIISRIGAGGMGTVYRGEDIYIGRPIAIKFLKPDLLENSEYLERFKREARIASRLNHPNAITMFDHGVFKNSPYLVMQFVDGITLKEVLLKTGALALERTENILKQVGAALSEAHSMGVVHRDLKPDNVMLSSKGSGLETARILDFGIAKPLSIFGGVPGEELTRAGVYMGTPLYMSPEQALDKPCDARSDIYALGIILYEMITGEVPFRSASPVELLVRHINDIPTPIREFRPELNVSPAVSEVVSRALEKDPDNRFQSIHELVEAFSAAMSSAKSAARIAAAAENKQKPSLTRPGPGSTAKGAAYINGKHESAAAVDADKAAAGTAAAAKPFSYGKTAAAVVLAAVAAAAVFFSLYSPAPPAKTTGVVPESKAPAVTENNSIPAAEKSILPPQAGLENSGRKVENNPPAAGVEIAVPANVPIKPEETKIEVSPTAANPGTVTADETVEKTDDNAALLASIEELDKKTKPVQPSGGESASGSAELTGNTEKADKPGSIGSAAAPQGEAAAESETPAAAAQNETPAAGAGKTVDVSVQSGGITKEPPAASEINGTLQPFSMEQIQTEIRARGKSDDRKYSDSLYLEGRKLFVDAKYPEAAAKFKEAIVACEANLGARLSLASTLIRLGSHDAALAHFEAADAANKDYPPTLYGFASYYASKNDPKRAVEYLKRAINSYAKIKNWPKDDQDFDPIRSDPEFQKLISK